MSIADQLYSMMEQTGGTGGQPATGMTIAKVTNVNDEEKLNRVKCLPLGEKNDAEETEWCYVMTPMGGKERGTFFFPQVDDLVVLGYLNGDIHNPLVLGALWTSETTPPYSIQDGKVQDYSIKTPSKIELLFHDEDSKFKASLTMPSEAALTLDDEKKSITLQDKEGKNTLSMDLDKGEITLKAEKKLTLVVGSNSITIEDSGKITIKGDGDIGVESGANLNLKGTPKAALQASQIETKADAKVSMQGAQIEIKADAKLSMQGAMTEVKADATMDVKASATMTLDGGGMTNLKGGLVKIN